MRAGLLLGSLILAASWIGCSGASEAPVGGPFNPGVDSDGGSNASSSSSSSSSSSGTSSSGTTSSGSTSGSTSSSSSSSGSTSGSNSSSSSSGSSSGSSSSSWSSGSSSGSSAPTWTQIYTNYIASGTIGGCSGCHSGYSSASDAYSKGGGAEWVTSTDSHRVTWFGGNMPPGGPSASSAAQAVSDMNAWNAAGALNN